MNMSQYVTMRFMFFLCVSVSSFTRPDSTQLLIDANFCGNKYENLVRLQTIVHDIPHVVIPEFIGIQTKRVEYFLRQHSPTVFTNFEQLTHILQYPLTPENSTKSQDLISTIQEQIKACFSEHSFEFTTSELNLFERIYNKQQFFMVRSTGIEDGAVANAGGNTSIAYVAPHTQAIQKAMAEVVASYFGMQSLKSRMSSGDILSSNQLCIPVLIQVLIGEPFDGTIDEHLIPISGVAYTTNQSLSSSHFKITEINAAYGHGEGVVANRVTADRYYITQSRIDKGLAIYPMLYHKQERLVPHREDTSQNSYTLIPHTNDNALAYRSTLSNAHITLLHTVLQKIESAYKQPMDVEFVILNTTLYLVQARPAMHVPMHPSYFAFEKLNEQDISKPLYGTTIVPGTGSLVVITNPNDIIIAKTVDEADQKANSTTCKAVIVSTEASPLSHAAVNFKTYGIPCIAVQNGASTKKLLDQISSQTPCIFDTQQRCICIWNSTDKKFHEYVQQGWLEHPIERTLSVIMDPLSVAPTCANPLPHNGALITLLNRLKKTDVGHAQRELLTVIAKIVDQHMVLTERRITFFGAYGDQEIKTTLTCYRRTFEKLIQEYTTSIEQNAERFELLFYHKMLEALLYQSADTQKVLGGYTYTSFLNDLYAKQAIFRLKKRLGTPSLLFAEFF